eukprot:gnl/Chilomastix_cuspidata/1089.p1 GENE.gnl/Chilomastix_cuspidata/1089~~gnl/Chilomastix_cuspidata/1089.p1  ORF type:complete len:861 (+),score=293.84 gnl/Chilomastix_cuspidata/1089:19-2601(+)
MRVFLLPLFIALARAYFEQYGLKEGVPADVVFSELPTFSPTELSIISSTKMDAALADANDDDDVPKTYFDVDEIPVYYSIRDDAERSMCEPAISNQRGCGSCWAFSSARVFNTRRCIRAGGAGSDVQISEGELVACARRNGCGGGIAYNAWSYLKHTGAVNRSCIAYTAADDVCPAACDAGGAGATRFRAEKQGFTLCVGCRGLESFIQQEILANGPVSTHLRIYSDFYRYESGVYRHTEGDAGGHHLVVIVGWGYAVHPVSGELELFWECANSWGAGWGRDGYFLVWNGEAAVPSFVRANQIPRIDEEIEMRDVSVAPASHRTYLAADRGLDAPPAAYALQAAAPGAVTGGALCLSVSGGPFATDGADVDIEAVCPTGERIGRLAPETVSGGGATLEFCVPSDVLYDTVLAAELMGCLATPWVSYLVAVRNDEDSEFVGTFRFRLRAPAAATDATGSENAWGTLEYAALAVDVIIVVLYILRTLDIPPHSSPPRTRVQHVVAVSVAWLHDTWFFGLFYIAVGAAFSSIGFELFYNEIHSVGVFFSFGVDPFGVDEGPNLAVCVTLLVSSLLHIITALSAFFIPFVDISSDKQMRLLQTMISFTVVTTAPSLLISAYLVTLTSHYGYVAYALSLFSVIAFTLITAIRIPLHRGRAFVVRSIRFGEFKPLPDVNGLVTKAPFARAYCGYAALALACASVVFSASTYITTTSVVAGIIMAMSIITLILRGTDKAFHGRAVSSVLRATQYPFTLLLSLTVVPFSLLNCDDSTNWKFRADAYIWLIFILTFYSLVFNILAHVRACRAPARAPATITAADVSLSSSYPPPDPSSAGDAATSTPHGADPSEVPTFTTISHVHESSP